MSTPHLEILYNNLYRKRSQPHYDLSLPIVRSWETLPDLIEPYMIIREGLFRKQNVNIFRAVELAWIEPLQQDEDIKPLASIVMKRIFRLSTDPGIKFASALKYRIGPQEAKKSAAIAIARQSLVEDVPREHLDMLTTPENVGEILYLSSEPKMNEVQRIPIDYVREPIAINTVLASSAPYVITD